MIKGSLLSQVLSNNRAVAVTSGFSAIAGEKVDIVASCHTFLAKGVPHSPCSDLCNRIERIVLWHDKTIVYFCNDPTDANMCIVCIYDNTCIGVCIVSGYSLLFPVIQIHSVVILGSQFPVLCVYERLHSLWNTRTHSSNIKVQLVLFLRWCIKVKTEWIYISLQSLWNSGNLHIRPLNDSP